MSMPPENVDAWLDRYRERFRDLIREILEEEALDSPFRMSWEDFALLDEGERDRVYERAAEGRGRWAQSELRRRGARWLVVVGDEVVAASGDLNAIPSDQELERWGRERNRVPFYFEGEVIEEVRAPGHALWTELSGGDAYPTLPLDLLAPLESALAADLDTGSPFTFVNSERVRGVPSVLRPWRAGHHLGRRYFWKKIPARLAVSDVSGHRHAADMEVRAVRAWAQSPFSEINPRREALVGRDLLRALGLRVALVAKERRTEVLPGDAEG
jgi:hypothetical protein